MLRIIWDALAKDARGGKRGGGGDLMRAYLAVIGRAVGALIGSVDLVVLDPDDVRMKSRSDAARQSRRPALNDRHILHFINDRLMIEEFFLRSIPERGRKRESK